MLTIIAAAAENNALGKDNDLVWHLPDDFKRFKKLTTGHHIIMGRKTFESFPQPLPNRTHVVITRQQDYDNENCIVVHNLKDALAFASKDEQPFIIGGGQIYQQALDQNIVDKLYITHIDSNFDGDTFFPEVDYTKWKSNLLFSNIANESNPHDFKVMVYEKS
mgnify:CR=1 FL=1